MTREMLLNSEYEIVGDGVLENESASMPVFGNVRQSDIVSLSDGATSDLCAVDHNRAGKNRAQAGQRFNQLCLTISLDTCNAEYLTRFHGKADVIDDADSARSHDSEAANLESLICWCCCAINGLHPFAGRERHFATDHQARDLGRRRF